MINEELLNPPGRWRLPPEIGKVARVMAPADASYITEQSIIVGDAIIALMSNLCRWAVRTMLHARRS